LPLPPAEHVGEQATEASEHERVEPTEANVRGREEPIEVNEREMVEPTEVYEHGRIEPIERTTTTYTALESPDDIMTGRGLTDIAQGFGRAETVGLASFAEKFYDPDHGEQETLPGHATVEPLPDVPGQRPSTTARRPP
jgi:hypothetical protein